MSTGYKLPKWHELQDDLIALHEVPERVRELSIVRRKELLIDLSKRIDKMLKIINWRLYYKQSKTFEHAALNSFRLFNYYELKNLESLISKSIQDVVQYNSSVFNSSISQRFVEYAITYFYHEKRLGNAMVSFLLHTLKSQDKILYKIIGTRNAFAEFYNNYVDVNFEKGTFKIKIKHKEPVLSHYDKIGAKSNKETYLNNIILSFEGNEGIVY